MTTETTTFFTYSKEQFEEVISYFDNQSIKDIYTLIQNKVSNNCQVFRTAVLRRIVSYKIGENWWFEDTDTRELVAIWKLVLASKKIEYGEESIDKYSYERLELMEKKVAEGKINENDYIKRCKLINRQREIDKVLIDSCACCCIGSKTTWENDSPLRIVCLPCGWDSRSQCVKFT